MLGYIILAISIIATSVIVYDINRIPETKDEEYQIDDPTTTCWHDDEHYPDSQI